MSGPRVWRCPTAVFGLFQLPLGFLTVMGGIYGGVAVFYRTWDDGLSPILVWLAAASLPGALLGLARLGGRLELVDALPDPRKSLPGEPATLALPDAGAAGPLRPERPAAPPARRWSADGTLFWSGGALMAAAAGLLFLSTDSFDAVLGIKLGGRRFLGGYWNHWWFVFYGLLAAGGACLAGSMALFVRGINRRDD